MIRRIAVVLFCFLAGALLANTLTDRRPPWDALLLTSFDRGDATDRSYSNRTPTVSSGATFPSGYRVVDFDGTSNAQVSFPDSTDLESVPLSVTFWARIDSSSTRVNLVGKCTVGVSPEQYRGWYIHFIGTAVGSNGITWAMNKNGSNYRIRYTGSPTTYGDGTWRHYALTCSDYNDINTVLLYHNGASVTGSTLTAGTVSDITNSELLKIGGQTTANQASYLNGAIDDLKIFSRVLSASEIAAIYAEGIGASRP